MIDLYYRNRQGDRVHCVGRYAHTIDSDRIHYLAKVIGFDWCYCSVIANEKNNFLENRVVEFDDGWVLEQSQYYENEE